MKRLLLLGVIIGVLALIFTWFGSGKLASVPPANSQTSDASALIARGREVAIASDCVACHTLPHGPPFAGGMEFHSPFGLINASNITPDPTYGIGNYNREDFFRAVKYGYSKNVGNLYPAMPYTSFRKISDDDVDALWAYFQTIEPISRPNRPNDLMFPANIRFTLGFWNQVFFDDRDFQPHPGKSEQWNRGSYLVEGAGHCGECHTPRNFAFAMKPDAALRGEVLEGWNAVDITPGELGKQGWKSDDMNRFLMTGQSRLGITFASMFTVVDHSLSHMKTPDIAAMTAYLLDEEWVDDPNNLETSEEADLAREYLSTPDKSHPGYDLYTTYCAGCHGYDGLGKPESFVSLNRNSIYSSQSSFNAIAIVLRGLPGKYQDSIGMPAFADELTDSEVTDLVNFARLAWSTTEIEPIEAKSVKDARELLQKQGWLGQTE